MAPQLPPEIQLMILELAIPPLTALGLQKRHEDILTLAIVHRTWTPVALRHLTLPEPFEIREGKEGETEMQLRLNEEKDRAASFLRLRLVRGSWPPIPYEGLQLLASAYPRAEHVVAQYSIYENALATAFPDLRRLTCWSTTKPPWTLGVDLDQLPHASLTSLCLYGVSRPETHKYDVASRSYVPAPLFVNVKTLLLQSGKIGQDPTARNRNDHFLTFFPALETLGWSEMEPQSPGPSIARAAPHALRHLYLKGVKSGLVGVANSSPSPLTTLAVANPSGALAGLEGWCEQEGVKLEYVRTSDKEVDLEAWAFSL
ncbi:hypothetical protein JCM10213v2_000188 [Rhodosporidiobolus nylandii]